jgi:hypothetical protein
MVGFRWWARLATGAITAVLAGGSMVLTAGPATATVTSAAQTAAGVATAHGYRTGIAVLNLQTGEYTGAGEDTASFASESVAKIFIATELLATGQMTGSVETRAYQMITESDDDDADALYGLAGGDNVINLVAARYGITFLGTAPSKSGWWGNTEINAKGIVYLYAAIAKDPVVGPWLMNAMANTAKYGADGTFQFFGIDSATTGASTKQGWGDDGDDSPNAVFNSTGYVQDNQYAVAILTDGPSSDYGTAISDTVTAQAQALMRAGQLDDPAAHNPVLADVTASATGSAVSVTGTATDPDTTAPLQVDLYDGDAEVATTTTTADHSFTAEFTATDGTHAYTATVLNVGEGTANASATSEAVDVEGQSTGAVASTVAGPGVSSGVGTEADSNAEPTLYRVQLAGGIAVGGAALAALGLLVLVMWRRRRARTS